MSNHPIASFYPVYNQHIYRMIHLWSILKQSTVLMGLKLQSFMLCGLKTLRYHLLISICSSTIKLRSIATIEVSNLLTCKHQLIRLKIATTNTNSCLHTH